MKKLIWMLLGAWASVLPGLGYSQLVTHEPLVPWSEFKGDTVAYLETNFSSYTYAKRYYPHLNVDDVLNDLEIPIKAIYVDILGENGYVGNIILPFHSGEYAKSVHKKGQCGDLGLLLFRALSMSDADRDRLQALGLNNTKPFYRVWDSDLYEQIKGIPLNNAYSTCYVDESSE